MGLGIVAMHYSGMDAMRMEAETHYDRLLWTLSAVIAVAVSLVGLTLVVRFGKQAAAWSRQKVVCAVVMGAAIPLMHYTGMAAASYTPTDVAPDLSSTMSVSRLGGAAIIFGTFLVLGVTFTLPGRPGRQTYTWLPALRVLVVALTLGIGGIGLQYVQERMVKEAGASLAIAAASIGDKLDLILYERYGDIRLMAEAPVSKQRDAAAMSKFLQTVKEASRYYLWLGVTDARGRIIAATNPAMVGQDRSGREWFQFARDQRKIRVQDAQSSEDFGGIMAVAFTAPLLNSAGEFLGTVSARVSVPLIEEISRKPLTRSKFSEDLQRRSSTSS